MSSHSAEEGTKEGSAGAESERYGGGGGRGKRFGAQVVKAAKVDV